MKTLETLDKILSKHNEIEKRLTQNCTNEERAELSKEYSELGDIVVKIKQMKILLQDLSDLKEIKDPAFNDEETEIEKNIKILKKEINLMLMPVDEDDKKNAVVEIRAGTGGSEASLFAQDLLNMYSSFALKNQWQTEILDKSTNELGGIKEVVVIFSGKNVFSKLKFESGVHRVQRVPETESAGRIHTSTATVAVLPEIKDVEIDIKPSDLRIDVFRSRGPGGQSVNTTDSAVRITHIPSGIVVSQQDEKSQHKNKDKAMKVLKARLHSHEKEKQYSERSDDRKNQIGTGDRSERIRTYNFHENRVTDHRIGLSIYKLDQILSGESLIDVINPLITHSKALMIAENKLE